MTDDSIDLINAINHMIYRLAGRHYRIDWTDMNPEPLREVLRLLRDLDGEKRAAVRRARTMPMLKIGGTHE